MEKSVQALNDNTRRSASRGVDVKAFDRPQLEAIANFRGPAIMGDAGRTVWISRSRGVSAGRANARGAVGSPARYVETMAGAEVTIAVALPSAALAHESAAAIERRLRLLWALDFKSELASLT